jgi:large subunit ribosomal protein L15
MLILAGKRIVELQTSIGLISVAPPSRLLPGGVDPLGRTPFEHPAIEGVECLTTTQRDNFLLPSRLGKLAENNGIPEVMRWVPKNVRLSTNTGTEYLTIA